MAKPCGTFRGVCDKYLIKNVSLRSPVDRLKADQIYQMMMQIKNGLKMTANPTRFTNKIVPNCDPLLKLRQNSGNELEVICPLPIAKLNVLNPSMVEEIGSVLMASMERLPQSDIAFKTIDKEKHIVKTSPLRDESTRSNFVFKIIIADLSPEKHFAVYPMQVKRWFPGTYTVYPDHVDA